MTTTEVSNQLQVHGINSRHLSVRKGVYTLRRSFFYTHGYTSTMLAEKVKAAGFTIIDHGEVWKNFRGGASVAKQSHWWVRFTIPTNDELMARVAAIVHSV